VNIASPNKHLLVTAGGAYIRMQGGDIELGAPGTIEFKATRNNWTDGKAVPADSPSFPASHLFAAQYQVLDENSQPVAGQPYVITYGDGRQRYAETDREGNTYRATTSEPEGLTLTLLHKENWGHENLNAWHQEFDKYWNE
jgi:uncharacterized protein (DUF2345 family)